MTFSLPWDWWQGSLGSSPPQPLNCIPASSPAPWQLSGWEGWSEVRGEPAHLSQESALTSPRV